VGSAGSTGAYAELIVTDSTPSKLYYQCTSHAYMGMRVDVNNNNFSDFIACWDSIYNGTEFIWDNNPIVWSYRFKRMIKSY